MRLFIAEKPSLGRAIADGLNAALGKSAVPAPRASKNGYIVVGTDVVTWCFGHLLEQYDPEDYDPALRRWSREGLPIVPQQWQLKPRFKSEAQLRLIGDLLGRAPAVVNAGDPDREGQLLVDEVLEHFNYQGPVQRVWLASLDDRSVAKALNTLSDNTRHAPLRDAAKARSQADWLVGLNATRAMTLMGREAGRQEKVLSLGRVQTPTLALVVGRDREIAAFTPVDFFVLQGHMAHKAGTFTAAFQPADTQPGLDSEGRLVDSGIVQRLAHSCTGAKGLVAAVSKEKKKKPVPLPHCLSTLQKAASSRLGMTAQEVLNTAQSLYEKKLTSYPRTDCRYLPTEQFTEAPRILAAMGRVPELAAEAAGADSTLRGPVWDTKKITAHHAIIPTGVLPGGLPPQERKLYLMIARAYVLQFYPPMLYEARKISVELTPEADPPAVVPPLLWEARGRVVLAPGWTGAGAAEEKAAIEDDEEAEGNEGKKKEAADQALPPVRKGDTLTCSLVDPQAKKTTPPSRFTEGSLIEAMANVHRFVQDAAAKSTLKENEGIGTEATRAGILETLKARGYLIAEKKALVSTPLGREIVDLTPALLKDPVTTAQWESRLAAIEAGTETLAAFMAEQVRVLPDLLEPILAARPTLPEGTHACPECGRAMRLRQGAQGDFWGCTGYPQCRCTQPDNNGQPGLRQAEFYCSECDGPLRRIMTRKGTACLACFASARHKNGKPKFWDEAEVLAEENAAALPETNPQ